VRLRRSTQALEQGATLQLFYDPSILSRKIEPPVQIADCKAYSVWYKPHGMLSQGSQWGDHYSVLRWVEVNAIPRRPCYLVHRLDGDAAGLILIAHSPSAAAQLSSLFQSRELDKRYQARVAGSFPLSPARVTFDGEIDGKAAVTHVKPFNVDPTGVTTLLDVKIESGRKHQIRRHLAQAGYPIVDDRLYGKNTGGELQLLAYRLAFTCPIHRHAVVFELPTAMQYFIATGD